jgi:hypothetical protein
MALMTDDALRYVMALYYAYGRNDSVAGTIGEVYVPPIEFAEHYQELYAALEAGTSSFCPSVQDAWTAFFAARVQ